MDDLTDAVAPSLPLGVSVVGTILTALVLYWVFWRLRNASAAVVLLAGWVRYITSIFHDFTFQNSPIGPSWNALASVAVFAIGIMVVKPRNFLLKPLIPLYLIIAISIASGAMNGLFGNLMLTLPKFGYLIVVMLCMYQALSTLGDRLMPYLLTAFLPPFIFQMYTVLAGQIKTGESDGSYSYVGGYFHEGAISVVMASAVIIACLARVMPSPLRIFAIVAAIAGIILADYRTTIVAFVPFLIVWLLTGPFVRFSGPTRSIALLGASLVLLVSLASFSQQIVGRYSDLADIVKMPDYLTRDPGEFNRDDQAVMSGRPYLWSRYLSAWREGPPHYFLIGAGPEARIPTKDKYPHNTLISATYEYGILGLLSYSALFLTGLMLSFMARPSERASLVAAHASFIILNMATMPMWQIEGNILYGLIWGYTLYSVNRARIMAVRRQRPVPNMALSLQS